MFKFKIASVLLAGALFMSVFAVPALVSADETTTSETSAFESETSETAEPSHTSRLTVVKKNTSRTVSPGFWTIQAL